ncbi:hypothetical protein DUNSADRAFT_5035 [Dunaliella salina]|uniref:Calcineurin-like phosphoesterase domain-containing protein n=1 Tax=Dunaliella salina TaxID=3046 RepID=A0ABQ7HAC1_DUNSA|nr:hypothetical protein DUNSADRAFT_5035 [Dunaliella salina]|eukprot:KAF5843798.1 hypothetical protein DUNSADRAFT_5035 [Dunaliella salina]
MDYIEEMHSQAFQNDVLIVAGDVADTFNATVHALKVLKSKFMRVFYVAGNHCLWNQNERQQAHPDSVAKLLAIMDACDKMGVDVGAGQAFNRPSLSWARGQLNTVRVGAASNEGGGHDSNGSSCSSCSNSNRLSDADELSRRTAGMRLAQSSREHVEVTHSNQQVITFSHFLPRRELPYSKHIPELGKAMGCKQLEDQLELLKSTIHVYGHSHIPTDTCLPVRGGSQTRRYVHNPLDGVAKPVLVCLWNSRGARGLDHQRATKLAQQIHAHSVQYAHKLVTIRRAIENKDTSHSQALEPGASSNPPE